MAEARRLSRKVLSVLDETTYLKIRSGTEHRFIWIWVVVVEGRAFAAKYTTPASLKYVAGFRRPRRRATTLELVPR